MQFKKGNIPFYKGKKRPEETIRKIKEARAKQRPPTLGYKHSEATKIKIKESNLGQSRSLAARKKMSDAHIGQRMGVLNNKWKGGITPLVRTIRNSFKTRQWRSDIFTRDNFICTICDKKGGDLAADHYPKMFIEIFNENKIVSLEQAYSCEEFWNINNGRTLCKNCHKLYGKRN